MEDFKEQIAKQFASSEKACIEAEQRNKGVDPAKVQVVVPMLLEIARNNYLNPAEFNEALKIAKDVMDYSLARVSANAWTVTALERAKL
ncbi:hypothetical protein [Lacrimispora sp.]|uniref:hypothetical protein n=1 Tax=Lacrimispora sp. TaxID=2719234 RepID=UPI0028ACA0F8|nr:hypothetical protein [Lacrimispora sp.]